MKVGGPKGENNLKIPPGVLVEVGESEIKVSVANPEEKHQRALWGTFSRLIVNLIKGVCEGYAKSLELVGVGFKVAVTGDEVVLEIGFSHPVKYKLPKGVNAAVSKNIIAISGVDKGLVGNVAAEIRRLRKPEPYKGKGIRYLGEIVRRKAGKTAKTGAAA